VGAEPATADEQSGRYEVLRVPRFAGAAAASPPEVAVAGVPAWESGNGVAAAVSHDGGGTFGEAENVLAGASPGRTDPSCPLRPTVGTRQRTSRSVRVAYDARNRVHVVAALADPNDLGVGAGVGGTGTIWHAVRRGSDDWATGKVTPEHTAVQWAPAIAPTPQGGVAVAWLQTTDQTMTSYDAYLAVLGSGRSAFGTPVRLSPAASVFASLMEAEGNSNCYGIGDYIGLAPSPHGVVAVWPTTDGPAKPEVDTDVYAREAVLR
jgi:hypothetical protein